VDLFVKQLSLSLFIIDILLGLLSLFLSILVVIRIRLIPKDSVFDVSSTATPVLNKANEVNALRFSLSILLVNIHNFWIKSGVHVAISVDELIDASALVNLEWLLVGVAVLVENKHKHLVTDGDLKVAMILVDFSICAVALNSQVRGAHHLTHVNKRQGRRVNKTFSQVENAERYFLGT
jgi:hypothetical protein